jgi:HAD superfamily hydrolase (TIGR01509 family)
MDHQITGVLFDMGGVLAALDGVPPLATLLGIEAEDEAIHTMWLASPAVVAHETGRIGPAEFAARVVADLELPVTAEWFLEDFFGWLKGPLPGAAELLNEIPRVYSVAALSNMSAVHWDAIVAMGLTQRFDQIFVSHEIGCLKPASEAFAVALDGMQLRPSEVLFLDDGQRNIDAAKALGFVAHLVKGPDEARLVLEMFGVIPSRNDAEHRLAAPGR